MHRRTLLRVAGWAAALGFTSRVGMTATDSEIASLLTLLEEAPREQLPGRLAGLIQNGLSREDLIAALALATARNVQPYPDVGFKYHTFMVLHAIQLTADNLDGADAWLPGIWAVDYFKRMQAEERQESGWRMTPPRGTPRRNNKEAARNALVAALENWDREAADAAVVDYARLATGDELFAVLFPYGARDLREIGHKAITVQNAHRLMHVFGPDQAEPVLRSAVAALLNTADDSNPAEGDFPADRPWRAHQSLLSQIPATWRQGRPDATARDELLQTLRETSELEAGNAVVDVLRAGVSPETIWEALFAAGTELIMRRPSVVPVHAVTTANALRYAYEISGDERTQQLMLLQCAAFIPLFHRLVANANPNLRVDGFEPLAPDGPDEEAVEEILAEVSNDTLTAARKALHYLSGGGSAQALISQARLSLARNTDEAHAYKFAEAAFENRTHGADTQWQNRMLAGSMVYMTGPATAERNPAVVEAAELLRA